MSAFYDYRLKFSKNGPIRFVGHLDVMRYMQKAIRRAGLPVRYSEGFSPHQILSFALPLSVGATSDGEYLDMSFAEAVDPAEITARLNAVMHEGIEARACVLLPEHAPKAMTVIAAARYRLQLREETVAALFGDGAPARAEASSASRAAKDGLSTGRDAHTAFAEALRAYLDREAIPVEKKTGKGARTVDLKPLIHEWQVADDGTLTALLHAGSRDHVKPALVYEGFFKSAGGEFSPQMLINHRIDLYAETVDGFVPLIH